MTRRYSLLWICLLTGCGRSDVLADQNELLQTEIQKLQARINDLETEANVCNTKVIQKDGLQADCEAGVDILESRLQCSEWHQANPADRVALGLEEGDQLVVDLDTRLGAIRCDLLADVSPHAVRAFVQLVKGEVEWTHPTTQARTTRPIYSGTLFHRVIPGFMIQGGDPTGTGLGGPGFALPDQFDCSLPFTEPGLLALANTGEPGTAGSQFFITTDAQPSLNGRYTVLGRCQNLDVIRAIASVPRGKADRPLEDVTLKAARISVLKASR